jgi:hypothetical protein
VFAGKPDADAEAAKEREKELYEKIGRLKMELEWLQKKLARSPVEERRRMIEPKHPALPITPQCALLGLPRASYYHHPLLESDENPRLLWVIDEDVSGVSVFGSRQMASCCRTRPTPAFACAPSSARWRSMARRKSSTPTKAASLPRPSLPSRCSHYLNLLAPIRCLADGVHISLPRKMGSGWGGFAVALRRLVFLGHRGEITERAMASRRVIGGLEITEDDKVGGATTGRQRRHGRFRCPS